MDGTIEKLTQTVHVQSLLKQAKVPVRLGQGSGAQILHLPAQGRKAVAQFLVLGLHASERTDRILPADRQRDRNL